MESSHSNKKDLAASLGISESSLYYQSKQAKKDWQTKTLIEEALRAFPSYGHKRLALHLSINKKRVLRVMRLYGIKPYRRRGKKPYKKSSTTTAVYPNLLMTTEPARPHHIWAADFTYLPFQRGFVYLATVLDLFTREIVGFSLMTRHTKELVINALLSALQHHPRPTVLHSDNGREYNSKDFRNLLTNLNIQISRSKKGCPWENGYQESFYSQFKVDLGDPNRFESLGELTAAIYQTIYQYNHHRIHTALRMAPHSFAQRHVLALEDIINPRD